MGSAGIYSRLFATRPAANSSGLLTYPEDMDVEKTITEIEWLERTFALPDARAFSPADPQAANRRHDETQAANPWFKLWRAYGLPR